MGYAHGIRWTEELIRQELLKSIDILQINRMPTAEELKSIGKNSLHCKISRTKKYSGYAKELGLSLKSCDTRTGNHYEEYAESIIKLRGYQVERMTTKHPYDLLINDNVKIDVKSAKPTYMRDSRVHTFGISKRQPTCDIYMCIAISEVNEIERLLIIPSKELKIVTLCIGKESKYNKFIDRWDYLNKYIEFYQSI